MKHLTITLLAILLFSACDDENDDFQIDSYPMAVGNEWTYDRKMTFTNHESEKGDIARQMDTLRYSVRVWIEKDTIMDETMSVKKFKAHEQNSDTYSTEFLFEDYDGVKCYAYYPGGGLLAFVKNRPGIKLPPGIPFGGLLSMPKSKTNELVYENPPTLNLKLPLTNSILWTYRLPSEDFSVQIDKRVIKAESIDVPAGTFECFKIRYEYSNHPSFEDVEVYDWIAREGLIKRQISTDSMVFINQQGDTTGVGSSTNTYALQSFMLN